MRISKHAAGLIWLAAAAAAQPAGPGPIAIADAGVFPESLAAARDGTVYVGNLSKGAIYRAAPRSAVASPWIDAAAGGMNRVMGLLVDEHHKLLWACTYAPVATGAPPVSSIQTFDLATGKPRQRFAFPGKGCNDMAIARDETVYATDFNGGAILRLRKGETAFAPWAAEPGFASVDGIAFLGDGTLIANTYTSPGTLLRIPIGPDGAAGKAVPITTSRPLVRPDGMRSIGGPRLLMIEGEGRLDEVTIAGDTAQIRPIREGIANGPTAVALAGPDAVVSIGNFAAMRQPGSGDVRASLLRVPYRPGR